MSLRERTRPGFGIIEPCLPSPAKAPPSGPIGFTEAVMLDLSRRCWSRTPRTVTTVSVAA
jgi:hypothetical protein